MTAIPVHHTDVDSESEWDGAAEVAAAREEETTLVHMHAWVDAEGDANSKGSYKFPHHAAGDDTAANMAGVQEALDLLPDADIPEEERADVEAHLRAHMDDANAEDESGDGEGAEEPAEDEAAAAAQARTRARIQHRSRKQLPIRSFEGSARPHDPFWNFVSAEKSESKQVELEFYGVISEYSWFEDDITPRKFKDDLTKFGGGAPILLKVDSPGGDVFAASVIRSILMDYPGKVTARVDGIAASAAVMVTMGAENVQIMDHAYMMIHDPYILVFLAALDADTMTTLAKSLVNIKDGCLDVYAKRTGLPEDEIAQMMADETWMSARQALNFGFANEVISGGAKQQARVDNLAFVNSLRNYAHVPPAIMRAYSRLAIAPAAADGDEQAVQALRDRVQTILKEQ